MKSTGELIARLDRIHAVSKAKRPKESSKPEKANVVQLPIWPEAVRAVPNGFLRSALFGAIAKGRRRYLNGEDIAAMDGITVRYKGERLDQGDLDVWESVAHTVREQGLGSTCRLTSYSLLKLMGKADTGNNRTTLQNRIERLVANALTIKQGRHTYIGSLISRAARDEDTHEWVIELDPGMRPLYAADQFTQIQWAVRRELNGHQLAQWLHGFYASHAEPFPIKTETLLKLCGSEDTSPTSGRQKLRKALDTLVHASEVYEEQFDYEIIDGLVHVQKKPSKTQQKHLNKKISKPKNSRA